MAHNNKHKRKVSAAVLQRSDYIKFITEAIIAEHGPSYATPATLGNRWRTTIPYSKEVEQFLIKQSRLYLRVTNYGDPSKATDPAFLHALAKEMADYLSKYTMQADEKMLRRDAEKALVSKLYTNNPYIQGLLLHQSGKREERKHSRGNPQQFRANQRKQEQKARNQKNQLIATEVHIIFVEANDYKQRKR